MSTYAVGRRDAITDVPGVLVGHSHLLDPAATLGTGAATGATVVRTPGGAVASVDVRGGGPGTRETDLLDPANTVQHAHAVLLAGGSAYGLAAAQGVMHRLEVLGDGIPMGGVGQVVPIVPAAVIFDLRVGDWSIRPTPDHGHQATRAATEEFARGSVGAGVGALAGSLKGGIGSASVVLTEGPAAGVTVGALVVANPVGSVFDPRTGLPWGDHGRHRLREPDPRQLITANALAAKTTPLNTTIGVVATDAPLSKAACRRVAGAAHDGLARAVRPAHSPFDGDTFFALSTGTFRPSHPIVLPPAFPAEVPLTDAVGTAAALCVERAIVDAILTATSVAGIPTYADALPSAVVG